MITFHLTRRVGFSNHSRSTDYQPANGGLTLRHFQLYDRSCINYRVVISVKIAGMPFKQPSGFLILRVW